MFSRNSASSRAIPFKQMVESVTKDPFIPIAWQKEHKGMQGFEYFTDSTEIHECVSVWLNARDSAVNCANSLCDVDIDYVENVTKQLGNRLLEPFLWHTVLVTATEYENFFELRCPRYTFRGEVFPSKKDLINSYTFTKGFGEDQKYLQSLFQLDWFNINTSQAEIHIQALAENMWDAMNESTPKQLQPGDWHIPFGDRISIDDLHDYGIVELDNVYDVDQLKLAIAVARCARLSYMTFDNEIDYIKDIKLHDQLLKSKHMSPFEHVARTMTEVEYSEFFKGRNSNGNSANDELMGWCNNFKGFIPYRYLIENT
jgi:hypothetical protein